MRKPVKQEMISVLLRDRLLSGYYPRGKRLPEERKLAEDLGVSRKTLRAALARLESENLLCRYPRLGTFIHLGESEKENFCYYVLPCHDYSRMNYPSMIGHLRLISGTVQACADNHAQCVMLPMSNDNNPEHLLAERLCNLPKGARLFLPGAAWYSSLFPLFLERQFRIVICNSRPEELRGDYPNIHSIGFDGTEFFRAGLRFLKERGYKRPLFVTKKGKDIRGQEFNTPMIQIDNNELKEIPRIRKAFSDFQCDSLFCEVFPKITAFWSLNPVLDIPEGIPILMNDNIMDSSGMSRPPHLIGFDFQYMAKRGIEFLFSDERGQNELCNRIIFN